MKHTSLSIFLGGSCNLNCSYCFIDKKNLKKISPDVVKIKRSIDFFLSRASEDPTINFTGGEPLLYWEILRELIEYLRQGPHSRELRSHYGARQKRVFIVVSTNATLLDEDKFEFFKKNNVALSVSSDGKKEINDLYRVFKDKKHSVFETVWRNIKNLDKEKIKVSSVFTPETVGQLAENVKFFTENRYYQLDFYPEIYGLWSKEQLKNLEKVFNAAIGFPEAKPRETSRGLASGKVHKDTENFCCQKLNLAPNGKFYLCDKVFSFFDKRRKKYVIGDGEKGIDEEKRKEMLKKAKKEILEKTNNKCSECSWINSCFCPIGLYLWCKENNKDFKKHFKTFCGISKIYISAFLKICQNQKRKYY